MPCHYCGTSLKGGKRTRDHVVPKSKGGTVKVDCCHPCNNSKGDLSVEEFRVKFFEGKPEPHEFYFERIARLHTFT